MAVKTITTHDALVKTATVEIKTLTISGKQVTLAVYRQLPEEPLVDSETGQLNGVAWGRVNYHPEKCGGTAPHLHVVWQKGEDLRRSAVYDNPQNQSGFYTRWEYIEALLIGAAFYRLIHGKDTSGFDFSYQSVSAAFRGRRFELYESSKVLEALNRLHSYNCNKPAPGSTEDRLATLRASMEGDRAKATEIGLAFINEIWFESDPGERTDTVLLGKAHEEADAAKAFCQLWHSQFKALSSLDQLFIAV